MKTPGKKLKHFEPPSDSNTVTVRSPSQCDERTRISEDIMSQVDGTKKGLPPKVKKSQASGNLEPDGDPFEQIHKQMKMAGTDNKYFASLVASDMVQALPRTSDGQVTEASANGAMAALSGVAATDEIEGMLGAQMVACHTQAMRFLANIGAVGTLSDRAELQTNLAIKLMRTFSTQVEALNRYRGKGQQKVTVEHVTVNQGGQAVIGTVERPIGNGGGQ